LSSSISLDAEAITALVARIAQARRLYAADSSYAIGLVTGVELLLEDIEGGGKLRDLIHARILEADSDKPARPAVEAGGGAQAAAPATAETLAENTWIRGIVKWFNNDKGYGFISTPNHIDVFVHWRDISSWDRSLSQGDEVEFMVTRTAKGFQAVNVMKGGQEAEARQSGSAGAETSAPVAEKAAAGADGEVTAGRPEPPDSASGSAPAAG
jgi:cold shock protein